MNLQAIKAVAQELVVPGKGILVTAESGPTIEKRFQSVGVATNETNRRAFRELLFATPGLSALVSEVVLYDETLRQKTADGTPFAVFLARQGLIPRHQGAQRALLLRARCNSAARVGQSDSG